MACVGCGESVAAGARFCSTCGRSVTYAAVPPPPPAPRVARPGRGGGFRPRAGRQGGPLIAYVIAWVVMPNGQLALPAQAGAGGPGSMRV